MAAPKYKVNVNTLEHLAAKTLHLNEIGVCNLNLDQPIAFDPYAENRDTGGFILIDRMNNTTVGAGLLHFALRRSQNIHWQAIEVNKQAHAALKGHRPCVVWFTGLSGAGKSVIANLVAWKLDCRLAGLAEKVGAQYTRYADDLFFSGDRSFGRGLTQFREFVLAIAIDEGFFIRHHKTRTMRSGGRQIATGLVLNQRLNVPREEYDQLRAILHNCARDGLASQNRDEHPDFLAHLQGRVAYVAATNAERGQKLMRLLQRIAGA